jgi:hypothetical protein
LWSKILSRSKQKWQSWLWQLHKGIYSRCEMNKN